jgi:hypothetical protein
MTILQPGATLALDVLAPAIESGDIRSSDRDESFIALSSAPGLDETVFLGAIMPRAGKAVAAATSKLVEGEGFLGARVSRAGETDIALFSRDGVMRSMEAEGFSAEASRCAVTLDRSGRTASLFIRGKRLSRGGEDIFAADRDIAASVRFGPGGKVTLEADAPEGATVTIGGTLVTVPKGKSTTDVKK